jgi:putative acetyltransferase
MPSDTSLSVRMYGSADLDATVTIFLGAIRRVACKDYDQAQIDAWAHVDLAHWGKRRLCRPTWVALLDGVPVGFTDLEPDGHIDMMYVHPGHQGIGIATLLLATVENAAKAQNLSCVFTEASITAKPFFEKRGFSVLVPQRVETRGQMFINFRMQKIRKRC